MPIVIKEIEVKTVVERELSRSGLSESQINRIKGELLRELKDELQTDMRKRKDR